MPNDARPEDNRAVCEAGICGWEVTLEVYDAPAAGPVPVAAQPAGPDAMATRTPVSGSQPPQVGTLVANPGAGPQPAPGPALDTALGKGGAVVTAPGSVPPSQPPLAPAGGGSHPDDVAGSKDHPLVPRARGAVVRTYDLKKLDAYQLPLGPAVGSGFARSQMARGRLTFLVYELAPDCSVLEAGEHYAAALRQSGFETLFACEDASCGPSYGPDDGLRHPYWSSSYGERQVTAVLRRGGGTVYASVHVQGDSPSSARAWVTVVESAPGTPASAGAVSGPSTSPPGARQSVGSAAPGSKPAESAPVSGIGAAAPPVSGGAPQGGQSPVSGIGAGTQQLPGGSQGGQSPVSGIGAAGRASGGGSKAPQSQVPQPELTPEQRKALDDCIAMKLIGAGSQAGPQAAQNARSACEQQLGLPSTVAR